jgi:hypothetical protein
MMLHTQLRYMAQGESPCIVTRCQVLPGAIVSLIATGLAVSATAASSLELSSQCEHPENQREVHLGENWTLSENGGTKRMCSFPVPNWQRMLSCVWFEIVKRMRRE